MTSEAIPSPGGSLMGRLGARRVLTAALVLLALLGQERTAQAHLMAPGNATVHVVGTSAYSVVWLPAAVLDGVPRDGAGRVAQADVERVAATLARRLQTRWTLRDGAVLARTVRLDLILQPPDDTKDGRADQLVMLHHAVFPQPPKQVELETDLFGQTGMPLTVGASCDHGAERAELRPPRARHVFFAPPARRARSGALVAAAVLAAAALVLLFWRNLCNRAPGSPLRLS